MDELEENERSPLLPTNSSRLSPSTQLRHSNRNLYTACGIMILGSLSVGFTLGMSSPMIPNMQKDESSRSMDLTSAQYTWFGSLLSLGAMIGALAGGNLMQFFGRKPAGIICGIPFIGGMLMMAYTRAVPTLLLGRGLTGVGVGIATIVVPSYLSETATENLRGFLGSCSQLMISLGVLAAYAIGDYIPWRWLAIVGAVPCATWTTLSVFIPETPRFLLMKSKTADARKSLKFLRGQTVNVETELEAIYKNIQNTSESASWLDVATQKYIRSPFLLTIGVAIFRQLSGQQCLLYYSKTIFQNAGLKTEEQLNIATISLATVQVVFTLVPCGLLDKIGRKVLLIVSGISMAVTSAIFGIYLRVSDPIPIGNVSETTAAPVSHSLDWLGIFSLLLFMVGFSIGFGPIFWLLVSELIPIRARGKASAVVTCLCWALGFLITKEFADMQDAFSPEGTFWIFSGISALGVFFNAFLLPETKGKTLEEISSYFEGTLER